MPTLKVTINGNLYEVEIDDPFASNPDVVVNGERYSVTIEETTREAVAAVVAPVVVAASVAAPVYQPAPRPAAPAAPVSGGADVTAPMPGKVLAVKVKAGDKVAKGDEVVSLEAMKMAMAVRSTSDGTVRDVRVAVGQSVRHGEVLVVVG